MSKARKGLSYVLGEASANENHILPVNAMQFSARRHQLFTAGRDGLVKVWSGTPTTPELDFHFGNGESDETQDLDERLLRLETAISSNPLHFRAPQLAYHDSGVRNYNVHFDWINDVKLVNGDRSLVTALADLTLKLINLDGGDADVHKFQNIHTDYIKKVLAITPHNLVVSGGLDGNVVVWDLATLKPTQQWQNCSASTHLPRSVYALSNNHGNLILTGGPNNTINIYDRRITAEGQLSLIRRLVGHQDNVRCLLMNSQFILSGSSDTTVKLWDMRNFKVYKNLEVHEEPVWSLSTACLSGSDAVGSDFGVFYSGDKGGNIVKTDLRHLLGHAHLHEHEQFPTLAFSSTDLSFIDEKVGLCTLVAKSESPIVSLCVEGENLVFASTYTSLERYHVPDTELLLKYQYLRACVDYLMNMDSVTDDDLSGGLDGAHADQLDLNLDFYDIVSHLLMDSANLDMQLSLSGTNFSLHNFEDDFAEYMLMFLNTNGGPSLEYVNAYKDAVEGGVNGLEGKLAVDQTPVEMLLNPVPPERILTIPFNRRPFQYFQISPKLIISKRMFNNKRCLLTLYLNGDIKIWDVFMCKEIKTFPFEKNACPLSKEDLKERTKAFDMIFQEHQTMDTLNNWCEVEIKSGKLLVSLSESSISNVDIYYDDLVKDYPYLAYDHPDNTLTKKIKAADDERIPIARIFLNSIFHKYALFEYAADAKLREDLRSSRQKQKLANGETETQSVASTEELPIRKRLFTRMSSKNSIPQASPLRHSPSVSISSNVSESGTPDSLEEEFDASTVSEDSIAKILQANKLAYMDKLNIHGGKKPINTALKLYTNDPDLQFHRDDEEHYKPRISSKRLPGDLLIIVFENSPDLGNYREVCSFHLSDLTSIEYPAAPESAKAQLVKQLRCTLPKWIGQPILYDKFPHKEQPKIAFQLYEVDYLELPADKKIGGRTQKKIKKLPVLESSIKLTSQNMLRVNKILNYLTDKFDSRTSEMKDKKPPSEWLVLECRGQELEPAMTLQTIKTKIWKSNADIDLRFRRKFDP